MLKENVYIFADYICGVFNESIKKSSLPSILKNPNITPVFKKGYRGSKENYRPASILPVISKIFEKLPRKRITISHYCPSTNVGLEKVLVHNTVYSQCLKNGKTMQNSKAFDYLPHKLIIAKLNPYEFNLSALKQIHGYLSHRKQRAKVNHAYSSWEEILFGLIRPCAYLFNIFLGDMLLVINDTDFFSYAGDNTIYDSGNSVDDVISSLKESSEKLFQWFSHDQMKGNTDKCHLIVSTNRNSSRKVSDKK